MEGWLAVPRKHLKREERYKHIVQLLTEGVKVWTLTNEEAWAVVSAFECLRYMHANRNRVCRRIIRGAKRAYLDDNE